MADTQQRISHPHPSILMLSYTQSRYSVVYMLYSYSLLGPINLDAKSLCAEEVGGECMYISPGQAMLLHSILQGMVNYHLLPKEADITYCRLASLNYSC